MKKKGFTLIELLAVIVVLAIIALIATPIVMNTIKNSKKGAAERTADNYVGQVETSLMTYRMNNNESFPDGTYSINEDGNLIGNGKTLTIEMNGTKPSSGSITIENGQVKKENVTMKVGDYDVSYDTDNKTFVASESNGSNVEILCKAVTELSKQDVVWQGNIQTGVLASEAGPYAYGVEYTCELGDNDLKTFYMLEENDDTVSLIMNINIDSNGKGESSGNGIMWSSDGSNANGPVTALEYLKNSTKNWSKLDPSQISLPSGEQIATAGGDSEWNVSKIDGNLSGNQLSVWLYENLYINTKDNGYWTSSLSEICEDEFAWMVRSDGYLRDTDVTDTTIGVRPVITLSKAQLG